MSRSDFDLDLRYGQAGEVYVNHLLTSPIETVECKRDKRWIDTGNLYVETQCWSDFTEQWYDSGLAISRASHWSFILEEMVITVPIQTLIKAVGEYGAPIECDIEPNPSRGYLITINALIMAMKGKE
jgi:hypothetical protein